MQNLKKYYIESNHDIVEDSYENGQLNFTGWYKMDSIILAENERQAIEKYASKVLGFEIDFENINIDNETGEICTNILVDKYNFQDSINDVDKWKRNEIMLYSDQINFSIYEMNRIYINQLQTI